MTAKLTLSRNKREGRIHGHRNGKPVRYKYAASCGQQGYSNTCPYPDLMCQDGYMRDMDADGFDPSVWAVPCPSCNPEEYAEYLRERDEEDDQ